MNTPRVSRPLVIGIALLVAGVPMVLLGMHWWLGIVGAWTCLIGGGNLTFYLTDLLNDKAERRVDAQIDAILHGITAPPPKVHMIEEEP
jgi:hypothetical protein